MNTFHIIVRGCPETPIDLAHLTIDEVDLQTLVVPSHQQSTPLTVTFEHAADLLQAFPRLHFEPDGAFVWVSPNESPVEWQVDGNLYDRGVTLNHVEIKGRCSTAELTRLLRVFGADSELMIEHVSLAIFVKEKELQKLLV